MALPGSAVGWLLPRNLLRACVWGEVFKHSVFSKTLAVVGGAPQSCFQFLTLLPWSEEELVTVRTPRPELHVHTQERPSTCCPSCLSSKPSERIGLPEPAWKGAGSRGIKTETLLLG